MKFKDLKIGQKFRFVGPSADLRHGPAKDIRTKVSSRTFTNPDSADDKQANGKPWKRTSRLEYPVAVVKESRRLMSFKEFIIEASAEKRYWFNVKTKNLVKVTEAWHDWGPISRPEVFGLKPAQVKEFVRSMDRGNDMIDGVGALMRRRSWVRVSASFREWNIRATTLIKAAAAAKALSKKHGTPKRLFLDAGNISKLLMDGEIDDFIKTGKIIKRTEIGSTMARFRS